MVWFLLYLQTKYRQSRTKLKGAVLGSPELCRAVIGWFGGERGLRAWEERRASRVRWLDAVREARAAGVDVTELYRELWAMRADAADAGRPGGSRRGGPRIVRGEDRARRVLRLAPLPRLRLDRLGPLRGIEADADVAADVESALEGELWSIESLSYLADAMVRRLGAKPKAGEPVARWTPIPVTADDLREGARGSGEGCGVEAWRRECGEAGDAGKGTDGSTGEAGDGSRGDAEDRFGEADGDTGRAVVAGGGLKPP